MKIFLIFSLLIFNFGYIKFSYGTNVNANNKANINNNIYKCNIPQEIKPPKLGKIDCKNKTNVDYYMLALSWSPQFCYKAKGIEAKTQCKDNKFGFIVHGLWPQKIGAKGKCEQPRNCNETLVDSNIIKQNFCIMPSQNLIQNEWQKHGSCAFSAPKEYYATIQNLWNNLNKPDLIQLSETNRNLEVKHVIEEFIKINPKLKLNKQNINVQINNSRYLEEVRICYDLNLKPTKCEDKGVPEYLKIKVA